METVRSEIACLMYHEVTDDPASTGLQRLSAYRYTLTPGAFVEHLSRFAAAVRAPEQVTGVALDAPGRHLLLTFDDGGKSALYAAGEMARRGWKAHFFIVTSRIGEPTFLDRAGLLELQQQGHLVGTHSHTHPDIFRDLTRAQMLDEWRTSRAILEDLLGEPCVAGSVPGGDISAEVLDGAGEAGLRFLFTSEPWTTPRKVGDCWILGRACCKAGMSADSVEHLVRFRGWKKARLERGLKEIARHGMAPLYRLYVERSKAPRPPMAAPGA
jgi:peptidoglycan/xylan/chitin deacetylase (PgdA/CDA1 family)